MFHRDGKVDKKTQEEFRFPFSESSLSKQMRSSGSEELLERFAANETANVRNRRVRVEVYLKCG